MSNKKEIKVDIKKIEEELQFEDDSNEVPPKEVFTFNELRSCSDLFRMYKKELLEIQPIYQRDIVWGNSDKTRFVDSLLKRLPIPSLCFSQNSKTNKMQVIDGLQRISTICQLFDDANWKLSILPDIDKRLRGKTIKEIKELTPDVLSDIENFALPVTLLRCNYSKTDHVEYIFTIFRRLNTGGLKLTNQEIRNAIFSGPFNNFLRECNNTKQWSELLKKTTGQKNKDDRFRSIEIVLKFFAFYDKLSTFKPGLSNYLNGYMKDNRFLNKDSLEKKKELFNRTIKFALGSIYARKPIVRLNGATFEAVLHGIAKNIDLLEKLVNQSRQATITRKYKKLLKQKALSTETLSEGLYQKQKVVERFSLAESIFADDDKL